ncbi:MAG: O-antigen ligase family protein [Ruminococcus sp.]
MEKKQGRTPMRVSVSPWKLTLPGKILVLCVCLLPFLTRRIEVSVSDAARSAYYLSAGTTSDFEQLCREIGLLVIAAAAVIWFCYERLTMRPKRELPVKRLTAVMFLFLGIYLLLGLLSSLLSEHRSETWLGIYMLYEGYLALVGYAVIFAAAWYWIDREEVLQFVKNCLTGLAIVIGILALLEQSGICYYNNYLVQLLGNLGGTVGLAETVVLTFGNADYLGMYCAMLLPLTVSLISGEASMKRMMVQITAAVLLGAALLLTKVMNAILLGFGMTVVLLLIWAFHSNWKRTAKISLCGVTIAAVIAGGCGFIGTRSGDTLSEKLRHTMIGMEQEDTFRLLSIDLDGDTIILENADTVFTAAASGETLSAESLTFTCNGTTVEPQVSEDGLCSFSEPALEHCQVQILTDRLQFQLGYARQVETVREPEGWHVISIGGGILTEVPQVSESRTLQKCYPYLNGRIFVWANTISALKDCWLVGHGAATTIFYLEQEDLPALLNIFGTYVLYNKPHSWYLQIAQDTGILSLVMILGMLVLFAVCGFRKLFSKGSEWNAFRTGLFLSVLTYCLTAVLSDSLIYHAPMFWFLFGMSWRDITAGMAQTEKEETL